jgi:hypothetical protein
MQTGINRTEGIKALALGLHPRLGENSPIGLIDGYTIQMISDLVCEDQVIEDMLTDFFQRSGAYPEDEDEHAVIIQKMRKIYLGNPNPMSKFILDQFLRGQSVTYKEFECNDCPTCGMMVTRPGYTHKCPNCYSDDITYSDSTEPYPPWLNIEDAYWNTMSVEDSIWLLCEYRH